MFRISPDKPMTPEMLGQFLADHQQQATEHYQPLMDAYCNDYPIYREKPKEDYKPDNRISVNFAKYIVDTLNGFFIGNPVAVSSDDDEVNDYVQMLDAYNSQDDQNAELSKMCSIFGHAYEHYFVDENGKVGIVELSPLEAFIIHDDSVNPQPLYFVRYYQSADNVVHGELCDSREITPFTLDGSPVFGDPVLHGFDGVPVTEYMENRERLGVFESVLPAINAYNKALSEKANEVDYFSDSYLAILGANVDMSGLRFIRENRVINFPNADMNTVKVDFLERPSGDTAQENLLNRLEQKIYQISMVCDVTDTSFGTESGEALKLKLRPMMNLSRTKERKFTAGMNRRYRLIFSNPVSGRAADDWLDLSYKFTFDVPGNLADEAQTARNLTGIVSEETILSTLSCVDDVQKEIERLKDDETAEEAGGH